MDQNGHECTDTGAQEERGNAKIENYRQIKTIGKGHYSK